MKKGEVAALVRSVACRVVEDMGAEAVKERPKDCFEEAYRRLWEVDKLSVEIYSDRFKVMAALRDAAGAQEEKGDESEI